MLTRNTLAPQDAKESGYVSRALDSATSGLFTAFPSLSDGIVGAAGARAKESGYVSRALDSATSGLFTAFPSLSDGIVEAAGARERRGDEDRNSGADIPGYIGRGVRALVC
ncbi:hypothetical protein [Aquisphaera insulae]|uniref:hypothetical protein n=1 Tax=Aquisphaera insulae TaxID=2712864 RepID=UPI0013E9C170|nr:hypothetical protein [Aquisphaera insulae]